MTLAPGTKLGPYTIVAPLGAGGMGEVYQARDSRLDRDVAVKVLPQAVAGDAERLARFQREAKALAAVNHPNIAQVFGLEDGPSASSAIVMELIDGEDLSSIVARDPIVVADAIAIARQIADALEAAHEQGIVHRDLKPGNIKVRADGTVKVLDFGLAKAIENASTAGSTFAPTITSPAMTGVGVILGTAAYMSPEQAKGRSVDRRTDVWSFGAVFFEMLTATRAFPGEDVTDTIVSIVSKEPEWSRLPAATPPAVRTLLRRCLVKDARRRLRDIGEARLILDDVAAGRTPAGSDEPRPASSRAWMAIGAASAAVVVASVLGFAAWARRSPDAPAPVTRFQITLPKDYQFIRTSSRLIALSPDGAHLVHGGNRQLYLRPLAELESRPIPGTDIDPAEPFFSPDGQWVGFYSVSDGSIRKIAISGGAPVALAQLGKPSVPAFQGAVWIGDEIFYSAQKGIMRVSANGGDPELLIPVEKGFSYGPQPLPGTDAVLFSRTTESGADRWDRADILVYSPRTKESTVVLRGGTAVTYLPSGHLVYAFGSSVLAVPFDLSSLTVTGPPVTLVEQVRRVVDAASGAIQFVISRSGTAAYIPGDARNLTGMTLALIDAKGNATSLGFPPALYGQPRVSPDGTQLVVGNMNEQGGSIWVADLKPGAPMRRLTFEGGSTSPLWSADSRWIYFITDRDGSPTLRRQLADGTGTAEQVGSWPGLTRADVALPGTAGLIVQAAGDLWLVPPGKERQPLTSHTGVERAATLSPDGRWLAYILSVRGETNVFVEPFPPTGGRSQVSTTGGTSPVWSPDGRRLYYNAQPGTALGLTSRVLVAVDVTTRPTFRVLGPPTPVPIGPGVLMSPRNFDITPDGKFLMTVPVVSMATAPGAESQDINVILNWVEELKRQVTTR